MKKTTKNLLFTAIVLAAALGLWLARPRGTGTVARVEIVEGAVQYIPLDTDGVYSIQGARLPVTLEVQDGRIRFIGSVCPDHLCEQFGWVQAEYDRAVCLPAGVAVTVQEG